MLTKLLLLYRGICGLPMVNISRPVGYQVRLNYHILRWYSDEKPLCRVIGENGENLGLMTYENAVKISKDENLELTQIALQNDKITNSVYKLINNFEEEKKIRQKKNNAQKLNQKSLIKSKELTLKSSIDKNDLQRKAGKLDEFLEHGYQVTIKISRPYRSQIIPKTVFDEMTLNLNNKFKLQSNPKESKSYFRCTLVKVEETV